MKNKTKIKFAALIFAVTLTLFTLGVSADDTPPEITDGGTSDIIEAESDETNTSEDSYPTDMDGNVFADIYSLIIENSDKIFAMLAFGGTMLVSFTYKKGLLPLLKNALSSLAGSVSSITESNTSLATNTRDSFASLCENMKDIISRSEKTDKSVESIEERLSRLDTVTEQYQKTNVILSSQIDMLYAIFMSSALPQYQKEEVCEKIKQMKEELSVYDKLEE